MSRTVRSLLTLVLLLIGTVRLPAPISEAPETTPTPKPKREATPRPKPKPEATPKPAAIPNRSFAGIWTGSTDDSMSNGSKSNTLWSIKISDDEKTVLINWHVSGESTSGTDLQAPCIRFGSSLSWSLKQLGDTPTWACTDTLQLNSNGTASFVRQGTFIAGDYQGVTYNCTGTFSRQSVSSPSSALSTIPSASPTAGPALNKSGNGFVALSPSGSMSGPRPESPPEARAQHLSGRGIFLLHFDKPTGNIIDVTVRQSTGSAILDQAAIATLRQWHATPGCPREVPMTIAYSSSPQ